MAKVLSEAKQHGVAIDVRASVISDDKGPAILPPPALENGSLDRVASKSSFQSADQGSLASDHLSDQKSSNRSTSSDRASVYEMNANGKVISGPSCDLCDLSTSQKTQAYKFCLTCNDFLCNSCYDRHAKTPENRKHKLAQGSKMPKSKADKPTKYERCTEHGKSSDQFCIDHRNMVCHKCIKGKHKDCRAISVYILSESISADDIQHFKSLIWEMKSIIETAKSTLESNATNLETRQRDMVQEVESLRDDSVRVINQLSEDLVEKITKECKNKMTDIENRISILSESIACLDKSSDDVDKAVVNNVGPNQFIRLQRSLLKTRECKSIYEKNKLSHTIDFSFSANEELPIFLSECKKIGELLEISKEIDNCETLPDIVFPQIIHNEPQATSDKTDAARDTVKQTARKLKSLTAKPENDDSKTIKIAGFDETSRGDVIVADSANKKIKLVSKTEETTSSLQLPASPLAVCIINETTAAVSTDDNQLHFIDVSDSQALVIERSVKLLYPINNMTSYQGNLGVVVESGKSPAVKLIDYEGHELWSVSNTQKGTFLGFKIEEKLKAPRSIVTKCFDGKRALLVSDWKKNRINLLDGADGHIIGSVNEEETSPYSIATDFGGNVFVAYRGVREIGVRSSDLQHCSTLLAHDDLQGNPQHIVYKNTTYELLVSYEDSNVIDIFQIL